MENNYWFRWYLVCSKMANELLSHRDLNFALLFEEEDKGRFANKQMTYAFDRVNESLSSLCNNNETDVFDENDFSEIAELSTDDINEYYEKYCNGRMIFRFDLEIED